MSEPIESWLHSDRRIVGCGLLVVCLLAWAWTLAGAGMGVSALAMTHMVYGDHAAMADMWMPATWTVGYAALMFAMWWVMMIAMMLPGAAPVILLAARVNRSVAPAQAPFGSSAGFLAGYLVAWGVFSLGATVAQWALQAAGLLSPMTLDLHGRWLAAALLGAAALWQLTPQKSVCLQHCRAPHAWLLAARGRAAFATGLRHGAWCVGCCWALMALLFVGGVMNLFWIAGIAALVLAEKLLAPSRALSLLVAAVPGAGALLIIVR